jgi:hypothetical protein
MCLTRYGTPTIGWRDGDRSALALGEMPVATWPPGKQHPNRRRDAEVAMTRSQTSTLTTVDFKHATPFSGRGIKVCADSTWVKSVGLERMLGRVRRGLT